MTEGALQDRDGPPICVRVYSGEIDVLPHSSQRRYTTGNDSERPMTFALGTPHRGQTIAPDDERFAI
jgi:hypothetical protein